MTSLRTSEGRIEYLKKRNNMLEKLRSSASYLDVARVKECIESVMEGYKSATNIKYMANTVRERNIEDYRFRSIALHHSIDKVKFLAKDYYWRSYFTAVGRAIARGEEKYIHRRISMSSNILDETIYYEEPDFTIINKGIRRLLNRYVKPDIILLPIELQRIFEQHYYNKLTWHMDGRSQLREEGCNLNVFWSNKYAPLKSIMIFNSNAGKWHVLEDKNTKNNIAIAIGESQQRKDKVAYFVETLACYKIVDKEAFIKIKLSHEGKRMKE